MFWRRGWILNSLKYQVEKDLRETVYNSDVYQKSRWRLVESQIIAWAKHPLCYVLLMFVAITLFFVAAHFLEARLFPLNPGDLYNWSWLYGGQTAVLSAQITLIGVVFPLVIGLVGFLLQKKTASNAIWMLYRHYSGFLFIGLSGLGNALFIIAGHYVETLFPAVSYTLWCMVSTLWLSANILLSGWFLWATFQIIHEPSRDKLLLRYTINESFTHSVRKRLSQLIPDSAQKTGLIAQFSHPGLEITTVSFSRDSEEVMSRVFKKEHYVSNVNFRVLNFALYIASKLLKPTSDEGDKCLVIPATVDNIERKKHVIATFTGLKRNAVVDFLLRSSYQFTKKQPFEEDVLDDIIFSLVGSASDGLRDHNSQLFEKSVKRLAEWHCAVTESLTFINDDKELDNWLLLPSSSFWSRSYLDQILREYYLLTQQAVTQLPDSVDYFEEMTCLYLKIYNWRNGDLPQKMVNEYIYGAYLSWPALVQRGSTVERLPGSSIYNQYESAMLAYVGAWERWPMYLEPRSSRWKDSIESVPLFLQHLRCTGQQVVTAVRHNDTKAAEWAADMLLHWFSNITLHEHSQGQYLWFHELITPNILERDSTDNVWQLILNQNPYHGKSATQLAMENAWVDLRLVCAAYIQSKVETESAAMIESLVISLIEGKRFKPTGNHDISSTTIQTGADILSAYIRQRCFWEYGENSYGNWLDSIVDAFNRIDEPKHVSGRIYSSFGANDVRSLKHQFIKFAIVRSDRTWAISQRWVEILFSDIFEHQHRNNLVDDLRGWLTIANDNIEEDEHFTAERINNFKESIESTIRMITDRSMNEIRSADIDNDRLIQFGRSASISGFSAETGGALIEFFKDKVHFVRGAVSEDPSILNINGYLKSNISRGIEVNRAVNEDEWLDDAVKQNVSNNLFNALCDIEGNIERSFETNHDLLKRVSTDIKTNASKNSDMKFFVGPWSVHRYLTDISYSSRDSEGLDIERRNGFGNTYICHLEGCPVYQLPYRWAKFSLLVPDELFDTLTFKKFENDRFVDVSYKDLDDDTLKLTLVLKYYMEPTFRNLPIYRYISPADDES